MKTTFERQKQHTEIAYAGLEKIVQHKLDQINDQGGMEGRPLEALYLDDPDGNGVELYWDRPREQWPVRSDGSIDMYTNPLDIRGLLQELQA